MALRNDSGSFHFNSPVVSARGRVRIKLRPGCKESVIIFSVLQSYDEDLNLNLGNKLQLFVGSQVNQINPFRIWFFDPNSCVLGIL